MYIIEHRHAHTFKHVHITALKHSSLAGLVVAFGWRGREPAFGVFHRCRRVRVVKEAPRLSLLTVALILVLRDQGQSFRAIVQNRRVRKKDGSRVSQQASAPRPSRYKHRRVSGAAPGCFCKDQEAARPTADTQRCPCLQT